MGVLWASYDEPRENYIIGSGNRNVVAKNGKLIMGVVKSVGL